MKTPAIAIITIAIIITGVFGSSNRMDITDFKKSVTTIIKATKTTIIVK